MARTTTSAPDLRVSRLHERQHQKSLPGLANPPNPAITLAVKPPPRSRRRSFYRIQLAIMTTLSGGLSILIFFYARELIHLWSR